MITDLPKSLFKRHHSDKHLSEFLPTRWRQKSTGTDTEQNYVTVTLYMLYWGSAFPHLAVLLVGRVNRKYFTIRWRRTDGRTNGSTAQFLPRIGRVTGQQWMR